MELPDYLITQIREGKAVLVLGAGASRDARDSKNRKCPTTPELTEKLANRFLNGKYKNAPLNQVAEYAISESDLATTQEYVRTQFLDLLPTVGHQRIPNFVWHGIATTNYDVILERAYEETDKAMQSLRPLIESSDRVEDNLRDPRNVLYLKLHGCITRINNPDCPLILTTEQYIEHRRGRARLFNTFTEWGYEHPIIFIGQSLQDSDLRTIINELTNEVGDRRPRYYLVAPDADEVRSRFWETKKITTLKATFAEFMSAIDSAIPIGFRVLGTLKEATEKLHEIELRFRTHASLSKSALQFLQNDVDYINAVNTTEQVDPKDFYRGYSEGFGPIEQQLDVRRELTDAILSDYFLGDGQEPEDHTQVLLIRAHAGAGKSVLLKRIAWDAAKNFDRLVLYLRPHGIISVAAIQELISSSKARIYLFVDSAADRVREVHSLVKNIGKEGNFLTVVLAERFNEWNMNAQQLQPFVTDEYEMRYLSMPEIDQLLKLLEANKALGTLANLDLHARRAALAERAGRQLLVALHEATFGVPFEDILVDEYRNIAPLEAQKIYLTICVLDRLDVAVRAGIVSRIHGVPFDDFKSQFFSPLEHVVFTQLDPQIRDFVYRARHPRIAEIVFRRILSNAEDRFDAYIKCLKALNLAYSADWKAFWKMIKGRTLVELFPDTKMVEILYDVAGKMVGDDPHLQHQMALYEMHRPNGNLATASILLNKATQTAYYDPTIKHSIAELKLRLVEKSKSELEQSKLLKEASDISKSLISTDAENSYGYHTIVKVGIHRLRDALKTGGSDVVIEKLIKETELSLFDSLQQFPDDAYLLESESEIAKLLNDDERATKAMRKGGWPRLPAFFCPSR
jgi:hypothetical protein